MLTDISMPHAIDVERALIGAIISYDGVFEKVSRMLKSKDFYSNSYSIIYDISCDLKSRDSGIDMILINQELKKRLRADEVSVVFTDMVKSVEDGYKAKNPVQMAAIIQQFSKRRDVINLAHKMLRESSDNSIDISDILEHTEQSLFDITSSGLSKDYVHAKDIVPVVYEEINKIASLDGAMSGIPSGLDELDKITGGFQSPDLIIIAARPGMGKTALGLSIASNISNIQNKPTGFFSLEMGNEQLIKRTTSIHGGIESCKLRDGNLHPTDWEKLDRGLTMILDGCMFLDDTPSLNILEFKSKARRMVKEEGVELIVVDYLQLMTAKTKGNREAEVGAISRGLKATAKELDVPIIALAQLNRGVEERDGKAGKKPVLSDLRESGSIEQDADMVIAIHRPEYYGVMQDDNGFNMKGVAELDILKHRNGRTGSFKVSFEGQYTRFQNLRDVARVPNKPNTDIPF